MVFSFPDGWSLVLTLHLDCLLSWTTLGISWALWKVDTGLEIELKIIFVKRREETGLCRIN
jgi:hypothetical protein